MKEANAKHADHEFGNVSTDLKLSLVEGYLRAFVSALRSKFPELWYIDAFAGTGERLIRTKAVEAVHFLPAVEEIIQRRRGSARIALDVDPAFDRVVFMDLKPSHCKALEALKREYPGREIDIVRGDANTAIRAELGKNRWVGKRAVMFLDPYGMHVDWSTLQLIRKTEAIDVWYLVSLAGLFRQASLDPANLTAKKRFAITRMLGTDEWEQAWYQRETTVDMLGHVDETYQRIADVTAIENFVAQRLKGLFPAVLKPKRLKNAQGVPDVFAFLGYIKPGAAGHWPGNAHRQQHS